MLVREAKTGDALNIARFIVMAESEMVHHFTGFTDLEESAKALVEFIVSETPTRYSLANDLVAEIDGAVAGAIISFPADKQNELDTTMVAHMRKRGYDLTRLFFEGEPGTYYLSTAGVDPAFRGKGVGTALIAAAEEKGRKLGFETASLLVSKGKEKARALYERLGYAVSEDVKIVDVEYLRMTKKLA